MILYNCSGLMVATDMELAAPLWQGSNQAVDVTIQMDEAFSQPFERPSENVVAELVTREFVAYSICRVPEGYVARLPRVADFIISRDLRHVVCRPARGGVHQVLPIVTPGTIVAFLLTASGKCVLHASAVERHGQAVVFVGRSGRGKSTMAAVFCGAGAKLITDDLLPILGSDPEATDRDGAVYCVPSGHEIRLREKAVTLAERFGEDRSRKTPDERTAVAPERSRLDRIPLRVIVLPRPLHQDSSVVATPLPPGEAALMLNRCGRIEGIRDRELVKEMFTHVSSVVSAVPVLDVVVPWGPPFDPKLSERISEACDAALARRELRTEGNSVGPGMD